MKKEEKRKGRKKRKRWELNKERSSISTIATVGIFIYSVACFCAFRRWEGLWGTVISDTCFIPSLILTAILKVGCYYLICTNAKLEDQRGLWSQSHQDSKPRFQASLLGFKAHGYFRQQHSNDSLPAWLQRNSKSVPEPHSMVSEENTKTAQKGGTGDKGNQNIHLANRDWKGDFFWVLQFCQWLWCLPLQTRNTLLPHIT